MALLKETLKVTRNVGPKRTARTNSSSQANQVADLSDIGVAKRVVLDCISELTFVNHFLDGNEETASVYRDKLRQAFSGECEKSEPIVIQGLSVSPTNPNTVAREQNSVTDSAVAVAERSSNRHRREAEIQTEVSETSMNRNIAKSHASLMTIDEACQKSLQQDEKKKTKRWYSCCAVGKRERRKKSNEKIEGKSGNPSSSKKSMVKAPEKSSKKVVICDDVS